MSDATSIALPTPLPWHAPLVHKVESAWRQNKMPHALLIHGSAGLGKRRFAAWIANLLLCESARAGNTACGVCGGCRLFAAGSHPDYMLVLPEEGKQQLSVEQIRSVTSWLALTSHQQGWKIALIDPAQAMTPSAANSLLKTLEEPPAQTLLMLIASNLQGLPATIRSRCQRLDMPRPERAMALEWLRRAVGRDVEPEVLEFAGGAPLQAQAYANGSFATLNADMRERLSGLLAGTTDVTRVAPGWAKEGLEERLVWLDLWTMSLAKTALAGTDDLVTFPDQPIPLPTPFNALNISRLYEVTGRIRELRSQLTRIALQRELAIEALLIELLRTLRPELMRQ